MDNPSKSEFFSDQEENKKEAIQPLDSNRINRRHFLENTFSTLAVIGDSAGLSLRFKASTIILQ
jgi:hypothetical protein